MVSATYKPNLDARYYPIMDTRPQNSVVLNLFVVSKSVFSSFIFQDMMLEGLEDDPDFWNMGPDDCDDDKATIPVKDLTLSLFFYTLRTKASV